MSNQNNSAETQVKSSSFDIGKPNILIILPIYLMFEKREPFAYQLEKDEKLEIISIYTLMYKFYIYNKLLVEKFDKDIYWSTIVEKQRKKLAADDLTISEYFMILMRMFAELEDLITQGKAADFESLIAFTLIRKEKEFSDVRDDDDKGTIWMMKISEIFKQTKPLIQAYFQDYWKSSGFTPSELKSWLSGASVSDAATEEKLANSSEDTASKYYFDYAVTVDEAIAKIGALKETTTAMGDWIDIRHMLTDNIRRNLIEAANKGEGREALIVRRAFDKTIFDLKETDLTPGQSGETGLHQLKRAITWENTSEQLEILEATISLSQGDAQQLKFELLNISNDTDKNCQFSDSLLAMIKDATKVSKLEAICQVFGLNRIRFNLAKSKVDAIIKEITSHLT